MLVEIRFGKGAAMLAEKFFLYLEVLIKNRQTKFAHPDGGPAVVSMSPHVPIKLPTEVRPLAQ